MLLPWVINIWNVQPLLSDGMKICHLLGFSLVDFLKIWDSFYLVLLDHWCWIKLLLML